VGGAGVGADVGAVVVVVVVVVGSGGGVCGVAQSWTISWMKL
jgi:hypothetical protein